MPLASTFTLSDDGDGFMYSGLAPHKFMPMPGVHQVFGLGRQKPVAGQKHAPLEWSIKMSKSDSGILVGLLIWVAIFYYIQKFVGWFGLIITVAIIVLFIFLFVHFSSIKEKRKKEALAVAPCKHGINGANQDPSLCPICLREKQKREEELLQQAEMRKKQAEERKRQLEEQRRQLQWWKNLDGKQFEKELAILLRRLGYDAEPTSYWGDGGVDIIIRENEKRIVVQCKAHRKYISPGVVRELYGTMIHEKADEGWLVTTSGFYSGAREFAHNKPIKLITQLSHQGGQV